MSELTTTHYWTSPVEVARVTPTNMEEIAEWCGGYIDITESRRKPGEMDKLVRVPVSGRGNALSTAFIGMFVTRRLAVNERGELKDTFAVFRYSYFGANYFATPEQVFAATWGRRREEEGLSNPVIDDEAYAVLRESVALSEINRAEYLMSLDNRS